MTILEQHAKTRGFKTAGYTKNLQKHCVFQWFLKVPRGQHEASWGGFWRRLGASWALLEPSWAPWARLESVLGASWGHLDRHIKKTLKTSSKNEPTRPKIETCLSMGTGSANNFEIISRPRPDHFAFILQTRFSHLPTRFRDIAILFRGVSESFVASFYLSQASAFEPNKALKHLSESSKAQQGPKHARVTRSPPASRAARSR